MAPTQRGRGRGGRGGRGGISTRTDKDGDVQMGAAPEFSSRGGRGGIRKTANHNIRGNSSTRPRDNARDSGRGRDGKRFNTEAVKKHLTGNDGARVRQHANVVNNKSSGSSFTHGKDVLLVQGVKDSKSASNDDKGLAAITRWLTNKASKGRDPVRISNSWIEGDDDVYLEVNPRDTERFTHMHGFQYLDASLQITIHKKANEQSAEAKKIKNTIETLLNNRYNAATKTLDLSALPDDPLWSQLGEKDRNDALNSKKLIQAILSLASDRFKSGAQKRDEIMNIDFSGNSLSNLQPIRDITSTFPLIQGLNLSNNLISDVKAFEILRRKLKALSVLLVSDNPFTLGTPPQTWQMDLVKLFPALLTINGEQVQSPEVAAANSVLTSVDYKIRPSHFEDQDGTVVLFVRHLVQGFDQNRQGLLEAYYDDHSTFSLSVMSTKPSAQDPTIKRSRNLMKITTPTARLDRIYTGQVSILGAWQDAFLPTRHHDPDQEPQLWYIESAMTPAIGSPTPGDPLGVNGFCINMHSNFAELDHDGQVKRIRSFDRSLIIAPTDTPSRIRVVSDILVLRDEVDELSWKAIQPATGHNPQPVTAAPVPTAPATSKPRHAAYSEFLLQELMNATGLTPEYAEMCLDAGDWQPAAVMSRFEEAKKAGLPADAFTRT